MDKKQIIVFAGSIALFVILFAFCDTKAPEIAKVEQSRILNQSTTDIRILLNEAKLKLSPEDKNHFSGLELGLASVKDDSSKVSLLKQLSSSWFSMENPAISGHYASQIAEIDQTEYSWSIAGTTYSLGLTMDISEKEKAFCAEKALIAYENAISINPDNLQHRVNLAVCLADYPPKDNPMKGILQLLDLNKQHPEYVPVLIALANFGLQTGQNENARKRLEKAYSLEPDNIKVICMLAELYNNIGLRSEADSFAELCNKKIAL